MSHLPETDAVTARQAQVVAYAVTHRGWTVRFGLPAHTEADILRACYGIGDATADEWAVIQGYIVPKRPYRSVSVMDSGASSPMTVPNSPFLSSRIARMRGGMSTGCAGLSIRCRSSRRRYGHRA